MAILEQNLPLSTFILLEPALTDTVINSIPSDAAKRKK